jgi:MGT family glycosyltransferase
MLAINERLISSRQLVEHLYGGGVPSRLLEGLQGLTAYFESARRLSNRYGVTCPGIINYLGNRQPLNIVFTSREFQIGGEVFDESYKFVGPSLSARVEDNGLPIPIPANGERPVFISMGTMYNDNAGFYRDCFDAFRDWPTTVVMAIGHRLDRSALPEPPQNFIVRDYVPQLAVLSKASLFITHGGLNSAHEAMFYGVLMLVLPEQADHYVVAKQVEAVGAGITLDRRKATPALLSKLAKDVLSEQRYRQKSMAMGKSLAAAGGSKRAADEIFCFKHRLEIH